MASKQDNNQEPSIEEILDSIRQIISDDDEQQAAVAKAEPAAPVVAEDDVIELTEIAKEDIQVDLKDPEPPAPSVTASPPSEPKPEPKPEPKTERQPEVKPAAASLPPPPESKPEPKQEPAPKPAAPSQDSTDATTELNSILTKNAEDSVMGAFTELTKRANIARADSVTIEDVVREELKPMLKEWLDKNLPGMVEKLLQNELERITKRVLGDDA